MCVCVGVGEREHVWCVRERESVCVCCVCASSISTQHIPSHPKHDTITSLTQHNNPAKQGIPAFARQTLFPLFGKPATQVSDYVF